MICTAEAHWTDSTVGQQGEVVVQNVPFEPGEPVDVLVIHKSAGSCRNTHLHGSVLEYSDPFDLVAS